MTPEEINIYIGLDYTEGSFGPPEAGFNCWGLLHYIQQHHFGVVMPKVPIGDAQACLAEFESRITRHVWERINVPEHGCGALLRGGLHPHVGVYLNADGGVILHALEGVGVVASSVHELSGLGFGRTKYYRLSSDVDSSSGTSQGPISRSS